jgi:hypothetical protein
MMVKLHKRDQELYGLSLHIIYVFCRVQSQALQGESMSHVDLLFYITL